MPSWGLVATVKAPKEELLAFVAYHLGLGADRLWLHAFLSTADDKALQAFYDATMTLTPEKIALLQEHDRLITADLGLRAKVADLLGGQFG